MAAQWYALQSKTNSEDSLCQHLIAQDLEVYYPCLRIKPVNPRSRKIRPYFTGYLFVKVDLETFGISRLRYSMYVKSIVSYGTEPIAIAPGLIEAIRAKVEEINQSKSTWTLNLKPGTRVKIQGGVFEGYEAIFDEKIPGRDRVRVLLEAINHQGRWLELPDQFIKPIPGK